MKDDDPMRVEVRATPGGGIEWSRPALVRMDSEARLAIFNDAFSKTSSAKLFARMARRGKAERT